MALQTRHVPLKHRNITLERFEKFISKDYWREVNLRGALYGSRAPLAGITHLALPTPDGFERAVRPVPGVERPLVRPRGATWLHPAAEVGASPLLAAVRDRGMRLSSSRCGDFRLALAMLATPALRGVGQRFVTHRFDAAQLSEAFEVARTRGCVKAVVQHAPAAGR